MSGGQFRETGFVVAFAQCDFLQSSVHAGKWRMATCSVTPAPLTISPIETGPLEKLKENAEKFKKARYRFELAQVAVGADGKTVTFIDRENCARGGSPRIPKRRQVAANGIT